MSGKKSSHKKARKAPQHEEVVRTQETAEHQAPVEEPTEQSTQNSEPTSQENSEDNIRLAFPYSDLVRAYAPKAMDVADKVATDWKKEGSFMNLGIENPYANMAVSMGLQKAKELEKKLEEKGVLSAVRMGVEVLKNQVNKRK